MHDIILIFDTMAILERFRTFWIYFARYSQHGCTNGIPITCVPNNTNGQSEYEMHCSSQLNSACTDIILKFLRGLSCRVQPPLLMLWILAKTGTGPARNSTKLQRNTKANLSRPAMASALALSEPPVENSNLQSCSCEPAVLYILTIFLKRK